MQRLPRPLLLLALLGVACAQTPPPPPQDLPPPIEDCPLMTVLIDTSRQGDESVSERVAEKMQDEFESFGARIVDSPDEAYWALMIMATENTRRDGFVFSAQLTARNMSEGYDSCVTFFGVGAGGDDGPGAPPRVYNGLSYGPFEKLDPAARSFAREAYSAVYSATKRLCDFEAADRDREGDIDEALPPRPDPL